MPLGWNADWTTGAFETVDQLQCDRWVDHPVMVSVCETGVSPAKQSHACTLTKPCAAPAAAFVSCPAEFGASVDRLLL